MELNDEEPRSPVEEMAAALQQTPASPAETTGAPSQDETTSTERPGVAAGAPTATSGQVPTSPPAAVEDSGQDTGNVSAPGEFYQRDEGGYYSRDDYYYQHQRLDQDDPVPEDEEEVPMLGTTPMCCLVVLLLACLGIMALRYGYLAWRRKMAELAIYQQIVREGKAEERTMTTPITVRVVTLVAMGLLFGLYLFYIKRRNKRREAIQSDYSSRQNWMFLSVILTIVGFFTYLQYYGDKVMGPGGDSITVSSSSSIGSLVPEVLLANGLPVAGGLLLATTTNFLLKPPTSQQQQMASVPSAPAQWYSVPCSAERPTSPQAVGATNALVTNYAPVPLPVSGGPITPQTVSPASYFNVG